MIVKTRNKADAGYLSLNHEAPGSSKIKSLLHNVTVKIYLIEFKAIVEKLAIYEAGTLV